MAGGTLILGGTGFLGSHLLRAARSSSARPILCAARALPGSASRLPADVCCVAADALTPLAIEALLDEHAPSQIHLATALTRIEDCRAYPALARALNVELPRRVARWSAEHGRRLVLVSTDLVFGREEPPPGGFTERDPPATISVYGESKAAGERAVLETDSMALVARVPLLYGDSFGSGRGASDGLLAALERGERPALFRDEWRTPLEVSDAARALVELAQGDRSGCVHLAGPERLSRADLARLVLEAHGSAPETLRETTRAEAGMESDRPRDTALDASWARAHLATRLRAPREALGLQNAPHS